jgi:hypothetical protein
VNKSEQAMHIADHTASAEHCASMAKCFSKASDAHAQLSQSTEVSDPAASKSHSQLADCYKTAATSCVGEGQRHVQACDKIASMDTAEGPQAGGMDRGDSSLKASLDKLSEKLDKLTIPDKVSAIPFNDNPWHVVPRPGAPTEKDRKDAVAKVGPRLAEVLGVDSDSQHVG